MTRSSHLLALRRAAGQHPEPSRFVSRKRGSMVGKSLHNRALVRPVAKRADLRQALLETYERCNPDFLDDGRVAALLEKYDGRLEVLLQRVRHRYDAFAAQGPLLYKCGRWKEVHVELRARGRLTLYRCRDDEALRALRAAEAFGAVDRPSGIDVGRPRLCYGFEEDDASIATLPPAGRPRLLAPARRRSPRLPRLPPARQRHARRGFGRRAQLRARGGGRWERRPRAPRGDGPR